MYWTLPISIDQLSAKKMAPDPGLTLSLIIWAPWAGFWLVECLGFCGLKGFFGQSHRVSRWWLAMVMDFECKSSCGNKLFRKQTQHKQIVNLGDPKFTSKMKFPLTCLPYVVVVVVAVCTSTHHKINSSSFHTTIYKVYIYYSSCPFILPLWNTHVLTQD